MERANYSDLTSAWNTKEVLYRVGTSTATPKPRAEGSNPSAPAIVYPENPDLSGFLLLFRGNDFRETAGDAPMMP